MINPPLVIPNTFVNGTVIDAGQMNANFAQEINFLNTNGRFAIAQNMTFFVGPGGTDLGNTGLNQSSPCATVNYVYRLLQNQYAWANSAAVVTIQLSPGSYTENISLNGEIPGQPDHLHLVINGDVNNAASYTLTGAPTFSVTHGAKATIQGVTLNSTAFDCIYADNGGFVAFGNVIFGNTTNGHVFAQAGGTARAIADYSVSGNMSWHWHTQGSGAGIYIANGPLYATSFSTFTITLIGSPTFTYWCLCGDSSSFVSFGNINFVNSAGGVGTKYLVEMNAVIDTFGAGVGGATFPGPTAGIQRLGGVFR